MPQERPTILVVDGDAVQRELVRRVLRRAGYRVLEAGDFRGAQNAHQQHLGQIHLLLTAIALPGGNGYELAEILLAAEPRVKVLFVSGETGAKISEFHQLPSVNARTLRRPFEPSALLRSIRDVLGAARATALA
jgi:two-component system cell cycle sensor histidine kinase/response regulator CckA